MLDLPNFSRLRNHPISHNPSWMVMLANIPFNIMKFNEEPREEPSTHIMTYHLWRSSNSLMDDSVRLRLFQISLTQATTKWYIESKVGSFKRFNDMSMAFLMHNQFPIHYDIGTYLLNSMHQYNSTHIYDHIHEWR
jgi:hypothetical protein